MKQRLVCCLLVTQFLVACGSGGLGDLGGLADILGSSSPEQASDIRGAIDRVDTANQVIYLDVNYVNNLREDRQGSTVYYDNNTTVEYEGRTYRVDDLERGDEVSIRGSNQSGRYIAERILVTRSIRG